MENNLYMKLEKYKWKVREVGFLRVVIRPKGIKIKEEKVKGVLDWPTLKEVKNISSKKRLEVELDGEARKDVQEVERKVYKRTSVSNTELRQKKWEWKLMYQTM